MAAMFVSPHNEFLVSAAHWKANLPSAIDAWIEGERFSQVEYQSFLREFGLSKAEVPLVSATPDPRRLFVRSAGRVSGPSAQSN